MKNWKENQNTIVAISTPLGNGAIGVLRLSGPAALAILKKVWKGKTSPEDFEPWRVYVGNLRSLQDHSSLDQVIAFYFKAPFSYTGEDVVEVQGHGGRKVMELLLENLIAAGARMAEPGEFTKRAFLNGRMDLTQAEAVTDIIQSTSDRALKLAHRQLEGRLSDYVGLLRNEIKVMRAQLEAMIDFPEDEDVQGLHYEEIVYRIDRISGQIQNLLKTYEEGRLLREGVRVAILGKPNAGKSSLFNALLKEDRSIVHPTPGTTRDVIEEVLDLKGLMVRFIDTAGIRSGEDTIESEGIRRAQEKLKQADLVLVVLDSNRPLEKEDARVFEMVRGKTVFFLYNKIDLKSAFSQEEIRKLLGDVPIIALSAKEEKGVDLLKEKILSYFVRQTPLDSEMQPILTNLRHRVALEKGLKALQKVKEGSLQKASLELLTEDLAQAMNFLGEVTGEVTNDEILGEIFSRFCLGK